MRRVHRKLVGNGIWLSDFVGSDLERVGREGDLLIIRAINLSGWRDCDFI